MTLSNAELYRLKSDARRGLLENDLILQRFFDRHGAQLNAEDGKVLSQLLALEDNDLMDLLICGVLLMLSYLMAWMSEIAEENKAFV
jgi:antitoxin CptB